MITNSVEMNQRLRALKDFGRSRGGVDIHDSIGYNFKFTELQACVGIAQMRKLPWRVARKKEIWQLYNQQLRGVKEVTLFHHNLERTTPWFIDALVEQREALAAHLVQRGIGTRLMYPPINSQKAYAFPGSYPVSEKVGSSGLWFPSATQLSNDDIHRICFAVREFYRR